MSGQRKDKEFRGERIEGKKRKRRRRGLRESRGRAKRIERIAGEEEE